MREFKQWQVRYGKQLAKVRTFLKQEMGMAEAPVNSGEVPDDLRGLTELARQFGFGDDIARSGAVELMPKDFFEEVTREVQGLREEIDEWVASEPWTETKSAFLALLQVFQPPARPGPKLQLSPEEVAEMQAWFAGLPEPLGAKRAKAAARKEKKKKP